MHQPDTGRPTAFLARRGRLERLLCAKNMLPILSTIAILAGLAGTIPQIRAMLANRSAAGQSPAGWATGIGVNLIMAYINDVGYHACLLAMGNLAGALLCAVALACTLMLPRQAPHPEHTVADLPTGEFMAVREAVLAEAQRRAL